jgi:hypothetical protein
MRRFLLAGWAKNAMQNRTRKLILTIHLPKTGNIIIQPSLPLFWEIEQHILKKLKLSLEHQEYLLLRGIWLSKFLSLFNRD